MECADVQSCHAREANRTTCATRGASVCSPGPPRPRNFVSSAFCRKAKHARKHKRRVTPACFDTRASPDEKMAPRKMQQLAPNRCRPCMHERSHTGTNARAGACTAKARFSDLRGGGAVHNSHLRSGWLEMMARPCADDEAAAKGAGPACKQIRGSWRRPCTKCHGGWRRGCRPLLPCARRCGGCNLESGQ